MDVSTPAIGRTSVKVHRSPPRAGCPQCGVSVDLAPVQAWTAALVERCREVKYVRLAGSRAGGTWEPESDWDVIIILDPDLYADPSPGPPRLGQLQPETWADFELWITVGGFGALPDVPECRTSVPPVRGTPGLHYWFLRPRDGRLVLGVERPSWMTGYSAAHPDPGPVLRHIAGVPFSLAWLQPKSPGVELYRAPDFPDPFAPRGFAWPCDVCRAPGRP